MILYYIIIIYEEISLSVHRGARYQSSIYTIKIRLT